MAVRNNLTKLIGLKQAAENRPINASTVARETGLTRQVVSKWMRGEVTEFRAEMIDVLCDYFNCDVGDLIYREKSFN